MRILPLMLATASIIACQTIIAAESLAGDNALATALAEQPEDVKARYGHRHPRVTLEFFEVEPGMTVVEALPGGGWYSKVLISALGTDGQLIGADYSIEMFPLFGFFDEAFVDNRRNWIADWTADAAGWQGDHGAPATAFVFGSMPENLAGTADRVLLIRALHNLARFEGDGGYLSAATKDAFRVLKPGGIVGVVQHQAREDKSDKFAMGDHGYLKKSFVIKRMEMAGFEFMGEIDINQNPNDQPGDDDVVWRLPPALQGSRDNPEATAAMEAIGESNRMTLKFRKPE
jgi:predicted methyltransferase